MHFEPPSFDLMSSCDVASDICQALVPGGKVSAGDVARIAATVVTVAPSDTLTMKWSATRAALGGGGDQTVDLLANGFIASSSITEQNLARRLLRTSTPPTLNR
jgi:hypothetical protein